jgi:hypothetical protein
LFVYYSFAGALVNALYLATGFNYATFADTAHVQFVRDTWRSMVAAPGCVDHRSRRVRSRRRCPGLGGERRTQAALIAMVGMHVALLLFGWVYTATSGVLLVALLLLLRAEHDDPLRRGLRQPLAAVSHLPTALHRARVTLATGDPMSSAAACSAIRCRT